MPDCFAHFFLRAWARLYSLLLSLLNYPDFLLAWHLHSCWSLYAGNIFTGLRRMPAEHTCIFSPTLPRLDLLCHSCLFLSTCSLPHFAMHSIDALHYTTALPPANIIFCSCGRDADAIVRRCTAAPRALAFVPRNRRRWF